MPLAWQLLLTRSTPDERGSATPPHTFDRASGRTGDAHLYTYATTGAGEMDRRLFLAAGLSAATSSVADGGLFCRRRRPTRICSRPRLPCVVRSCPRRATLDPSRRAEVTELGEWRRNWTYQYKYWDGTEDNLYPYAVLHTGEWSKEALGQTGLDACHYVSRVERSADKDIRFQIFNNEVVVHGWVVHFGSVDEWWYNWCGTYYQQVITHPTWQAKTVNLVRDHPQFERHSWAKVVWDTYRYDLVLQFADDDSGNWVHSHFFLENVVSPTLDSSSPRLPQLSGQGVGNG